MIKVEYFTRLSTEETQRELDGCKDLSLFIEEANEFKQRVGYIVDSLKAVKSNLENINLDDISTKSEKDYFPLLTYIENNVYKEAKTSNYYIEEISLHRSAMIKATGYDEDRAIRLFLNYMDWYALGARFNLKR